MAEAKSLLEQGWSKIDKRLYHKGDLGLIARTVLKFEHKISGSFCLDKIKSKEGKSIEVRVLSISLKVCKENAVHKGLKQE